MPDEPSLLASILVTHEQIAAALDDPFREAGLSFGSFELLAAVKASRGQCAQAELARRLGIRPASLCEAVQALSTKGLVEQVPSDSDRRIKLVRLTPKGATALVTATTILSSLNSRLEGAISATNRRATLTTLAQINDVLEGDL